MAKPKKSTVPVSPLQAVNLLKYALPPPIQRLAETRIGSAILFLGVPALILAGVLQLNWEGGMPHLTIDRDRAKEIEQKALDRLQQSGPEGQQLENSAVGFWNAAQGNGAPPIQPNVPPGHYTSFPNAYGQTPAQTFMNPNPPAFGQQAPVAQQPRQYYPPQQQYPPFQQPPQQQSYYPQQPYYQGQPYYPPR